MKRLLACLWYYFCSQRILPWICGGGLILVALGLLTDGQTGTLFILMGAVSFVCFPVLIGGVAYRQLIGNRRIVLVPSLRPFAAGGLFLLAVLGAALAGVTSAEVETGAVALRVAAFVFAAISLFLVLSQWLVTLRAGALGAGALAFIVLPILALRAGFANDPIITSRLLVPWPWLALAGLAWLWLAVAVRGTGLPRGTSAANRPAWDGSIDAPRQGYWLPPYGRMASAAGTLMRGFNDSWRNRSVNALLTVLLFPVVMSGVIALLGLPLRNPEAQEFGGEFFLLLSFFGVSLFPTIVFAEWPVRLRLLWLRVAGDRAGLWWRLERTLVQEIVLITAIVATVAVGFLVWSDVARELVWLYASGSALAALLGSYLGVWLRTSGWQSLAQALLLACITLAFLIGAAWLRRSGDPFEVLWLLLPLGLLALAFRTLARARFRRMDWCAVRPLRFPRRAI